MSENNHPSKFQSWLIASRPKTLLASVVPVMVGSALALSENKFVILYAVTAMFCSILIQVGTNFVNDLYDFLKGADNEKRKGPLRVLANGLITITEMKVGSVLVFLAAFLLGLYLVYAGGIVVFIIGVFSITAGIAYTAGPYPLAYNGLGDIFVFAFFGLVGTMGTYYVHVHQFTLLSFLVSIPVGALITNILVVNNYRDIEEDRSANKRTLAVIFGKTFTRTQYVLLLIASYIIPILLFVKYDFSYWVLLPLLTLPFGIRLITMLFSLEGIKLNKTLELSAKFSALFGILFSIGLIL